LAKRLPFDHEVWNKFELLRENDTGKKYERFEQTQTEPRGKLISKSDFSFFEPQKVILL
jgi:hypothetical protein